MDAKFAIIIKPVTKAKGVRSNIEEIQLPWCERGSNKTGSKEKVDELMSPAAKDTRTVHSTSFFGYL
jgi:hypothetical protein